MSAADDARKLGDEVMGWVRAEGRTPRADALRDIRNELWDLAWKIEDPPLVDDRPPAVMRDELVLVTLEVAGRWNSSALTELAERIGNLKIESSS